MGAGAGASLGVRAVRRKHGPCTTRLWKCTAIRRAAGPLCCPRITLALGLAGWHAIECRVCMLQPPQNQFMVFMDMWV